MNRSGKRKQRRIAMELGALVLIGVLLLWIVWRRDVPKPQATPATAASSSTEVLAEPLSEPLVGLTEKKSAQAFTPKEDELVLRSVGDVLIHDRVSNMADVDSKLYQSAVKELTAEGIDISSLTAPREDSVEKQTADTSESGAETAQVVYDFAPMLAKIAPFTAYADVTMANMEVIAAYPDLPMSGYPQFNAPRAILTNLKNIGIDIVSNGSNHTLDWYSEGALLSIENIRQAGLMYVGSYESAKDQETPRIIDKNGIKLGFLTYSYGTNGMPIEPGEEYIISLVDVEKMVADVTSLKEQVDAVVVTLQLGQEYDTLPDDNQRYVFQALSDAGVKLILGGHPHVLQPMDWYNGKETFAIYSQASFLSGQRELDNKQGGITEVTFKREKNGEVVVTSPKFMPIFMLGVEDEELYQVVPYADFDKYQIPEGQKWWDTIKKRMTTYTDDFEYVTHLETERTKEDQAVHR